ncbi:MAG TPA: hypothetical protein VFH48_20700 [Chloroflexota bacterium]|nr:hypothetical protein [Chloroflexota bacterium]
MSQAIAAAAAAFEETLEELGLSGFEVELDDPEGLGRRAALLVAAGAVWDRHLGTMLDSRQVQELLRVQTRQAVNDLMKRGRLLGLPVKARRWAFPSFQFSGSGRPYAVLPDVLAAFDGVVATPYTIASWFVSPHRLLDDQTPVEWLSAGGDAELVRQAADRSAARMR